MSELYRKAFSARDEMSFVRKEQVKYPPLKKKTMVTVLLSMKQKFLVEVEAAYKKCRNLFTPKAKNPLFQEMNESDTCTCGYDVHGDKCPNCECDKG